MENRDHLFQKGNPGGPGRPRKEVSIPDKLRTIGKEAAETGDGTKLDSVLRNVFTEALRGRSWAVEFIATRTEGKPKDTIDLNASVNNQNPWNELTADELRDFIASAESSENGTSN